MMTNRKTVVVLIKDKMLLDSVGTLLLNAGFNVLPFASIRGFLEFGNRAGCDYLVCSSYAFGISAEETMQVLKSTGWTLPIILVDTNGEALITNDATHEVEKLASLLDVFAERRANIVETA